MVPVMLVCLHRLFLVLLFVSGGSIAYGQGAVPAQSLSPVIVSERPRAVQEFTVDAAQVRDMVNGALMRLTSATDIGTAWTRLGITPQDTVGIKINTDGGQAMCTHHALMRAICNGLRAAGVPSAQIIIWDKYQDRMATAGYLVRPATTNHASIAAIVPANFYDPNVTYRNDISGTLMWGDYQFMAYSSYGGNDDDNSANIPNLSYYTKFVTSACTKIINVPVLTDNAYVGINGCLSSLALGCTDNNRRFQGPPAYGDPAICEILDQMFLRRKVVVHIMDALVAQCAGGPAFNPQFCQSLGAIYVGRDPVAIDSIVLPRLERMRRQMGVPPIGGAANYIYDAPNYNLGTTDRSRIQFLSVP